MTVTPSPSSVPKNQDATVAVQIEGLPANSECRIRVNVDGNQVHDETVTTDANGKATVDVTVNVSEGQHTMEVLSDETSGQSTQQTGTATITGT